MPESNLSTYSDRIAPSRAWLDFSGVNIALRSPYVFETDQLIKIEPEITSLTVYPGEIEASSVPDATIWYDPHCNTNASYSGRQKLFKLRGPEDEFGEGRAILYIAQYLAECARAHRYGAFLLHGAAVANPAGEGSHLLLGEKGAGKTTTAFRLCHEHGYGLIGNDQVIVAPVNNGLLTTVGGNAWFNVRKTALSGDVYLGGVLKRDSSDELPAWNDKFRVNPEEIGVKAVKEQLSIKKLLHIRIDRSQPGLFIRDWTGLSSSLFLHERLGRHVTGQATPFQNDRGDYLGSLPPVEPRKVLKARDNVVRLFMQHGVTEIFAPSSDGIIDYILDSDKR